MLSHMRSLPLGADHDAASVPPMSENSLILSRSSLHIHLSVNQGLVWLFDCSHWCGEAMNWSQQKLNFPDSSGEPVPGNAHGEQNKPCRGITTDWRKQTTLKQWHRHWCVLKSSPASLLTHFTAAASVGFVAPRPCAIPWSPRVVSRAPHLSLLIQCWSTIWISYRLYTNKWAEPGIKFRTKLTKH